MTTRPPAFTPAPDQGMSVFDRRQVRRQRARIARRFGAHDFLIAEVADRLLDRLADTTRRYPLALDLGCHTGVLSAHHAALPEADQRIDHLIQADHAPEMAVLARLKGGPAVCADEELLPFAADSLDLILSNMSLHSVNDLPGSLVQAQRALKPDGLLLAAMLGGSTLHELRGVLLAAEAEITGGASPRVAPFVDVRAAGGLLQRAGFALPVVDSDEIPVLYHDALDLMRDLRGMGLANALKARTHSLTARAILLRAAALYQERHATADGRITATFEVVYLHGWKPAPTQQQPLRPGSARSRLADALDTVEHGANDKAQPT